MYYLAEYTDQFGFPDPPSTASNWGTWLAGVIPPALHDDVRTRLNANLRHIMVSLEMKAGLIIPHATRAAGTAPLLFESYATIMIFEFCVGAFSVCEGLGSAFHLRNNNNDGAGAPPINPEHWIAALVAEVDPNGILENRVRGIKDVRNKIHQDRLGARVAIDWHAFSYQGAFVPALDALQILFGLNANAVPGGTNLN